MMYEQIDEILIPWLAQKGYQLQTSDRGEEVRAFLIWSPDHQNNAQIGIIGVKKQEIEIGVFDGQRRRERIISPLSELANALDKAERVAKQWIG
jgi:hypothetical protein